MLFERTEEPYRAKTKKAATPIGVAANSFYETLNYSTTIFLVSTAPLA